MGTLLSRARWRGRIAAAVVLAGLMVSGCSGGDPVFKPTMTQPHAAARGEQIMRETAAALTPRPTLEIYKPGSGPGSCMVNPNDTSDTRVQLDLTYWLRGIPARDNSSVAQQILRYWEHKGYGISGTSHLDTEFPAIFGVTPDDFTIALETSSNGAMSIGATSPCIWPKGTPPPH
jgi:hypothetical protein